MTTIKAFDTAITFSDTLTRDGVAENLTDASVKFLISERTGGTAFSASATIVSAAAGTVSYQPSAGFPTTAGKYIQEWEVTFSDGRILTFPGNRHNKIKIIEDINRA